MKVVGKFWFFLVAAELMLKLKKKDDSQTQRDDRWRTWTTTKTQTLKKNGTRLRELLKWVALERTEYI